LGKTRVVNDIGSDCDGAKGAKAVGRKYQLSTGSRDGDHSLLLIVETALNGLLRSMKTIPILNICIPPPDM
jgi:hypothetical protein